MNRPWKRLALMTFSAFLWGWAPLGSQTTHTAGSGVTSNGAVLVELFTSEGCSSCPPADALLRQINGGRTNAGQLIVGISEHVTYWNNLGWSDPYSSETFTARQRIYSNRFRLDSVYTPQMVIDGAEQIVGDDPGALNRALLHEVGRPQMPLHILSVSVISGALQVRFSANGSIARGGAEIIAVLTDDFDQSNVGRGENSGRTLAHVSVARSLRQIALVHSATEKTVMLPLPASFHSGSGGHHLILFAQSANLGPVLGVDTKPI